VNTFRPVCYLIHFERPYVAKTGNQKKQAQHYLGWTINLPKRVKLHATGQGARLLAVVNAEGIGWAVVRVWENGSYKMERELKARHSHASLCPICNQRHRGLLPKEPLGTITRRERQAIQEQGEGPDESSALLLFWQEEQEGQEGNPR
jgi:predicted GIY-YIG superfamily endonuclease